MAAKGSPLETILNETGRFCPKELLISENKVLKEKEDTLNSEEIKSHKIKKMMHWLDISVKDGQVQE